MDHVLLVDDLPDALSMMEAAVRDAFSSVRCTLADGMNQALAEARKQNFDLALVDLSLGDGSGIGVIAHLAQHQPRCVVVVATIHDDDDHLFQALQAGAQGYLLKDRPASWLARQLRGIVEGQPPLSPSVARRLLRHFQQPERPEPSGAKLTPREREVLVLLAQGMSIADIGAELGISRHTAGDHVKNVYRKLSINRRTEAALQARSMGLI